MTEKNNFWRVGERYSDSVDFWPLRSAFDIVSQSINEKNRLRWILDYLTKTYYTNTTSGSSKKNIH